MANSEEWSRTISCTINEDHVKGEMIKEISPSSSLFSFDMFFDSGNEEVVTNLPEIYQSFPMSIQLNLVFALYNEPIGAHPRFDGTFSGTVQSHSYILGKYDESSLWLVTKVIILTIGQQKSH